MSVFFASTTASIININVGIRTPHNIRFPLKLPPKTKRYKGYPIKNV